MLSFSADPTKNDHKSVDVDLEAGMLDPFNSAFILVFIVRAKYAKPCRSYSEIWLISRLFPSIDKVGHERFFTQSQKQTFQFLGEKYKRKEISNFVKWLCIHFDNCRVCLMKTNALDSDFKYYFQTQTIALYGLAQHSFHIFSFTIVGWSIHEIRESQVGLDLTWPML